VARRFSATHSSFEKWRASLHSGGEYLDRIVRGHARYPRATLSQLRRHPGKAQIPLSGVTRAPPSRISLSFLTPKERARRQRSLEVLSKVRRGEGSLSKVARALGVAPKTVRRASGAFRKRGGRWIATRTDKVQRYLKSYENGERIEVLISDSRTASLLSRYAHAVATYLETGDPRDLRGFEGKTYKDAFGKVHTFETRPEAIRAIIERSESDFGAFADLYAEPETADDTA
jgi:transposase-like protein